MKIAFKIPPILDLNVEFNLLIEVGKEDISFLLFSKNPFAVKGLFSFSLDNIGSAEYMEDVKNILSEYPALQSSNISSCTIFYNFPTSSLVPHQYFIEEEKENMLDIMFGADKSRICFYEEVKDKNIKNIFSIPHYIYNSFLQLYPKSKSTHSTTYQVNIEKSNGNYLQCIFYSNSIKVVLFKEGILQIVQYFNYTTASDVCYHLLSVVNSFQLTVSTLNLILSGMIDAKSKLYEEVYKYFLNISFAQINDVIVTENLNELQPHFYHHLTALATCV